MAAVHVPSVEARLAQLDGGAATDVEAVGTVENDRLGLRELADPLLQPLGIAPGDAFRDVQLARDGMARPHIDYLYRLPEKNHRLHLLDAKRRHIREFLLHQRARRIDLLRVLEAQLESRPVDVSQE